MTYQIHDEASAKGSAAELLKAAKGKYGFVPNLLGTMAEAPALLKAYMTLGGIFEETSFDATEKQIVLLAVSFANGCSYCMAAHSAIAAMQNVPEEVISALRENTPIPDEKLETLRRLAQEIATSRGYPSEETVSAFLDSGYSQGQILETVLGVGFKTLSNYTNHIAQTPLDGAFESAAWTADQAA